MVGSRVICSLHPPSSMSGPSARNFRYWLLILVIFTTGNYLIFSGCHIECYGQSSNQVSSAEKTNPFSRLSWMNGTIPETTMVLHKMAGWTVFKNLYIYGNTIYIVTSQPEILPPLRFIFSNGLPLEMQEDNEPDQRTVAVVSPHEADILFGGSAGLLDGVSVSQPVSGKYSHQTIVVLANRCTPVSAPYVPYGSRDICARSLAYAFQHRVGLYVWGFGSTGA